MGQLTADYHAYIQSPAWAKKRAQYWATVERCCQACRLTQDLHVHHMTYDRFKNEHLSDLIGLCQYCHELVHAHHRKVGGDLRAATMHIVRKPVSQVTYVDRDGTRKTVENPGLARFLLEERKAKERAAEKAKKPKPKSKKAKNRKTSGTVGARISTPATRRRDKSLG